VYGPVSDTPPGGELPADADLHRRLLALVNASTFLLESPTRDAVFAATIAIARDLMTADGYAVWRHDDAHAGWHIARAFGISDEFARRVIGAMHGQITPGVVEFAEPLPVEDVSTLPLLAEQAEAYRAEGITSMLILPLTIRGRRSGTLVFYFRAPHRFDPVEIDTGRALANLAAAATTTAELYDEQRVMREAAELGRQRAAFLAEAGATLAASLDYERTLAAVARLAVPHIADWCAVDVVSDSGKLQRLAVAHIDPAKVELTKRLQQQYPENPEARSGVHEVIRTGQPAMMSTIPEALLEAAARDAEHLQMIRELALTSYICVPLSAHGRTFGAMTFVMAESGRHYTEEDLPFAESVASRAALAVDNARAYQGASEANRLKDEFLATLSHELRTPLNAILGYSRMLRLQMLTGDKAARAIETVERNAVSLRQIIEDVLDVSRIVSGKLRLNVQPVDLPNVIQDAVTTVQPAADARGVRIQMLIDPLVTPVSGDPDRLVQVVWNLLSNAVKFTPRGGRIQLRLERVNSHVEIVVSDTGRGIAPEFLPFIFERFRQADSGPAREHGGLGLGLAIVRQIVEMHGGTVHAASKGPDRGATFRVKLPLTIVHAEPELEAVRVHPRSDRFRADITFDRQLDGLSIVAVDDETDALGLLRTILEAAGARVTTVDSAPLALSALAADPPDALIADIGMPGMDGFSLIREVRQSLPSPARHVPALALTAYARSEDRIAALAHGFQMHVAKPVDPAELVLAVARLAQRAGPGREMPTEAPADRDPEDGGSPAGS
jgi:signal transduction histidine kinase/ActR/RegA family two-component response regulator